MNKTLTQEYEEELEQRLNDSSLIEKADDYTDTYLKWGNVCDSSKRSKFRMEFVKEAEEQFLEENKKMILKRASELCKKSIGKYQQL